MPLRKVHAIPSTSWDGALPVPWNPVLLLAGFRCLEHPVCTFWAPATLYSSGCGRSGSGRHRGAAGSFRTDAQGGSGHERISIIDLVRGRLAAVIAFPPGCRRGFGPR